MTRLLLSIMSVVLAASIVPVSAYGAEAPTDYGGEVAPTTVLLDDTEATALDDATTSEPTQEDKDAQAAEQIVDVGGSASGETTDGGTILISKTIEATGIENYFNITLDVQVEELPKDSSTAVVVVMDVSNTMNDDEAGLAPGAEGFTRSRLQNAQEAANEFILEYCEGENLAADRMFGLVTFNTNAQWADGLALQTVSPEATASLQSSVNAITAPSTPTGERFTNMEAGLRLAYNALNEVDAAHKYVIFLTDGFPTTYIDRSIAGNMDSSEAITGYDPYESGAYVATKVGEDGYFADAVLGLPCTYGTSYSDKAAALAEAIAAEMKAEAASGGGINIFSVGIDIGAQTIQAYVDRATAAFSIVDRTSTDYVVGSATDPQAYRDWLSTSIAGGPAMDDGVVPYADGDSRAELLSAFESILSDIREATGFPLPTATVTDPMGEWIEFQHFFNVEGQAADSLAGTFAPSSDGVTPENTAWFEAEANAIQWDLRQSGYTLSETEQGSRLYEFELMYRVRLMTESPGFPFGATIPTNDDAVLVYEEADPQDESGESGSLVFPSPSVRAFEEDPVDPDPVDPVDPVDPSDPTEPSTEPANPDPSKAPSTAVLAQTGDASLALAGMVLLVAMVAACIIGLAFTSGHAENRRK